MPLGSFAPGYYSMTYAPPSGVAGYTGTPLATGLVEGPRHLRRTPEGQMIQADAYGKSDIDGVYQGGNMVLSMTLKEWTVANRAILWPFGGTAGSPDPGAMGLVGQLFSALAGQIVLTAVANTPAAGLTFATITLPLCLINPGTDIDLLLGNEPRDIPVVFKVFPYDSGGGVIKWFTYT